MKPPEPQHGRGAPLGPLNDWVRLAQQTILDLLETELAVAHPELEARLSEEGLPYVGGKRLHLDPHVLTEAVRQLRDLSAVDEVRHTTKGGATVPLLVPADQRRRGTAITRALRRKAMLYNRFRLLADRAGDAGEEVVRYSLGVAGSHLIPMAPNFGHVNRALNVRVPGALDSGAWLHTIDASTGVPRAPIAIPIEVKNRRLTLYPIHKELHQLLAKAADLQKAHPNYPIVPTLICRRAHPRLFWMAADLGFRIHPTRRQFTTLPPKMDPRLFEEVRTELRLTDLTLVPPKPAKPPTIQQFFQETLPRSAPSAAARWAIAAPIVAPHAKLLRSDNVSSADRQQLIRQLRQELEPVMSDAGFTDPFRSWSLPDEE